MRNTIRLAYDDLTKDKVMSFLIDKFRNKIDWGNRYNSNYPIAIANLIIEQQISFKAAITRILGDPIIFIIIYNGKV